MPVRIASDTVVSIRRNESIAMAYDVEALIASTLNIPVEQVTEDSDMSTVPNWDSMGHINLVLAIEEAYGVVVDEEAVVELTSVRAIRDFLASATRS